MQAKTRRPHFVIHFAFAASCAVLAGCVSSTQDGAGLADSATKTAQVQGSETDGESTDNSLRANARRHLGKVYEVAGRLYKPKHDEEYERVGKASWYGDAFNGRMTANGEVFDMNALSAAHPTLPLPSYVRVTNLDNDRSLLVRVNDRGPFSSDRVIDVSKHAAEMLGFKHIGTANVKVEYVDAAPLKEDDSKFLLASYVGPDVPSGPDPADAAANIMVAYAAEAPTTSPAEDETADVGVAVDMKDVAAGTPFDPYSALTAATKMAEADTSLPQEASFELPQARPAEAEMRNSFWPTEAADQRVDEAFSAFDEVLSGAETTRFTRTADASGLATR
ncbi:septal ring lytic transglycosylase RlpA family protein [Afifella aestuarii]|uniref:septal ring lytic transglycosylase RlpA family protein n=1 Tax=Afifella aestuarii TaxID=1909496 RepID=UPI000FE37D23|nr:septal ring lytic transglycosylase RlpA family protein [Afifella aestuarii]